MLDYLKSLFWPDEERRNGTEKDEQARKLEMDEPMEGAGTLFAGEDNKTETEENLERATRHSKKDGDF
jgi:hypothetical protein